MNDLFEKILSTEEVQNGRYELKSHVSALYDYLSAPIPEDLLPSQVSQAEIDKMVAQMEERNNQRILPETAEPGDCVICKSLTENVYAGRKLIFYPGLNLPGAEDAEQAVLGKRAGDELELSLWDRTMKIQIVEITRTQNLSADDDMVRKEGIEGVETLEAYRAWCAETIYAGKKAEAARKMAGHFFHQIVAQSAFEIDEEEKNTWLNEKVMLFWDIDCQRGNPDVLAIRNDEQKRQAYFQQRTDELEHSFYEYLIYRGIANREGVSYGPQEATKVIVDSAQMMKLTEFEDIMNHVKMHYLLETCYMQSALDILVKQMLQRL